MSLALLTSREYFLHGPLYLEQAEIDIVNAGMPSDVFAESRKAFNDAWLRYEREYLLLLMGKPLRDKFLTEGGAGAWSGLKAILWQKEESVAPDQAELFSTSPVADYIYFWYLNDHAAKYNGQSFKITKAESSTHVSIVQKQVWVWQRMQKSTREAIEWMRSNISTFDGFTLNTDGWGALTVNYNSAGI